MISTNHRRKELAKRIRELFLGDLWIANTNYKLMLHSISYQQAGIRFHNLNAIEALTFHVNYYLEGVLQALEERKLEIKDSLSFEYIPSVNEESWQQLVGKLLQNAERIALHIEQMPEENLDEIFIKEKYGTYQRNIEAIIEHAYYHLGQISLLKKLTAKQ